MSLDAEVERVEPRTYMTTAYEAARMGGARRFIPEAFSAALDLGTRIAEGYHHHESASSFLALAEEHLELLPATEQTPYRARLLETYSRVRGSDRRMEDFSLPSSVVERRIRKI